MFHILTVVVVRWVCKFVKTCQIKLVRYVHFIMCKLYYDLKREREERRGDGKRERS